MTRLFPVFLVAALAPAIQAEAPRRTHDITVEDYFTLATVLDITLSPDGGQVAFAEARWQPGAEDRRADVWVADVRSGAVRRLTFDRGDYHSLRWDADGSAVLCAGVRQREGAKNPPHNGRTQVWRIPLEGGEPLALTRAEEGIQLYALAPDGRALYYVTQTEVVEGDWKGLRERFRGIEYGHGVWKASQLWRLDLKSWRVERLPLERCVIRDMALSPDGRRLAMITTPDDKVVSFEGQSQVQVMDLPSRQLHTVPDKAFRADAPSPYGWLEHLAWSADSGALAFNVIFDAYPAEIMIADWADGQPAVRRMRRPEGVSVKGYRSPLGWSGARDLCLLGEEKARVRLYRMPDARAGGQGTPKVLTPGDVVVEAFDLSREGGRVATVQNDTTHFPDLFVVESGGKPRRLTNLNPQADTWKLPRISIVSWKGANGDPVEGILELPPDPRPGQRVPLVVEIHGGPTTAVPFHLQFGIYGRTLLPAKGYAVLSPNYRGSTGYGDKFLTDLIGRDNGIEVEDILRGVDALVKRGIADPERLGVMGWSNGGYLTNCLLTKTQRFKAASSGAGIVDAVIEWGTNDEPAYVMAFKQGFPWDRPDSYHRSSPTYGLDKIRTPTLIHVGANDERCPPGHSRMLYRALREYVKVPTELLVYPGEGHGLAKRTHRKAKMEWDLAWFDRYLRGKKKE